MSQKSIAAFAAAAVIAFFIVAPAAAQSDIANSDETLWTQVDFDQVFADVEAACQLDSDIAAIFRDMLYRAALRRINAVTYEEWVIALEAGGK